MNETKSEVYRRLANDGRWSEANQYRDRVRRELRDGGMRKAESNAESWRRMALQFPPLTSATAPNGELDSVTDESSDLPSGLPVGDSNFDEDVKWAWANLGKTVNPQDCRSGAAWVLHQMAIEQFDKFMVLAARSIGLRGAKAREQALKDRQDRDRQFALLDSIKRSFEEERARAS